MRICWVALAIALVAFAANAQDRNQQMARPASQPASVVLAQTTIENDLPKPPPGAKIVPPTNGKTDPFEEMRERRELMCKINAEKESADPMKVIVGYFEGDAARTIRAASLYKCYDMFKMMSDYGPNEQVREIGKKFFQTGTSFHLIDTELSSSATSSSAFSGTWMNSASEVEMISYYWMKRRLQESIHGQMSSLFSKRDPKKILGLTSECIAIVGNFQVQLEAVRSSELGSDALTELERGSTQELLEASRNVVFPLFKSLFNYSEPTKGEIAENYEVSVKLAPLIFASALKWEEAGFSRIDEFAEKRWRIVDDSLEKFCGIQR